MYSRTQTIAKLVHSFEELSSSKAIGDILITADQNAYNSEAFGKQLRSLTLNVITKMFKRGLRVITRSSTGRLHVHAAVDLGFEVTGFDWLSFEEAERWYRIYKQTGCISARTQYRLFTRQYQDSMCQELKDINAKLKKKAKAYGFGRIYVLPVKKNNDALKWYLVKNLPKYKPKKDKAIHYFSSWGVTKISKFKVLSKYYNEHREQLKKFCTSLGLTSDNYNKVLKDVIGVQWMWKCKNYIKHIELLVDGPHLPNQYKTSYNELRKTVKQYLIRSDQYC